MSRKRNEARLKKLEERRQAICKGIHERMGKKTNRIKPVKRTQKEYQNLPMRTDPGVKVRNTMAKIKKRKCNQSPNITNEKIEMPKIESPLRKFIKE